MRYLIGKEKERSIIYFNHAIEESKKATCLRSKCGAVIVKGKKIIGRGFNSPPGNLESQRRCSIKKNEYPEKTTDKTCCVHAEQRAVIDALKNNLAKIIGSRLYFVRLNKNDEFMFAGNPYCTICSKFVLDSGIKEFALWHKEGIRVYNSTEYNDISFGKSKIFFPKTLNNPFTQKYYKF
ncbi:MAG: deaminase [archaeon]